MELDRKTFLAELQWIDRFTDRKNSIPILAMALFEVDGNTLSLTATDLEVAGVTGLTGQGSDKWDVSAPVHQLIKYLQKVEDENVTISTTPNHRLVVKHGPDSTTIVGMSRESYPELPAAPPATIRLSKLDEAIARTSFAISAEESRFTLNGALLEIDEDEANMIATDGHRLALFPVQVKGKEKLNVLVPRKVLTEAGRLAEDCSLSTNEDFMFLDYGQRRIVARKLKGNFPDYNRVLPKDLAHHAFLPVGQFLKTIERVNVYADERSHAVRFAIADGKLTICSSSIESGAAEGIVPIAGGQVGMDLTAGYNATYAMDFLRLVKNDSHCAFAWQADDPPKEDGKISTNGLAASKAAVMVSQDGLEYVLMPIRL